MFLTVEQLQGAAPVTVLAINGALDASNFEEVINKARELVQADTQRLLLDLSDVSFMSSSGIVALHSLVLLMRGDPPHDLSAGWDVFHQIGHDVRSGRQPYVKLLNPSPRVFDTLQKAGMDAFFETYTDLPTALASFS